VADTTTADRWPRRLSPPADTILDNLEAVGWTQADLAERMGRTKKHVQDLVKNKTRITSETAVELSRTLGGSAQFWLNLEANYQAAVAERESLKRHEVDRPWLKEVPVADMRNLGWIEPGGGATATVEACLRFFGVATVKGWRDRYASQLVAFRTGTRGPGAKVGAVAAWMRRAELIAARIETAPWNKSRLSSMLEDSRRLSAASDQIAALKSLQGDWARAGVAVVFVRRPKACLAFGAAEWLTPDRAMIVVSNRYATTDQLWFTLFHEVAHLVLHGKKKPHVDADGSSADETEEREANSFATDRLIPRVAWQGFVTTFTNRRPTQSEVLEFAKTLRVAAGLVVGRLQHERRIRFDSPLRSLKTRVTDEMFLDLERGR
jgi:HTH-type transcriptional regulator / antitoxin HigA